jgi:sensor domain CHASE-containing protein
LTQRTPNVTFTPVSIHIYNFNDEEINIDLKKRLKSNTINVKAELEEQHENNREFISTTALKSRKHNVTQHKKVTFTIKK